MKKDPKLFLNLGSFYYICIVKLIKQKNMKLVKLADLRNGDVFLTKTSKLLVFVFREPDGTVCARRYSDQYYLETLKDSTLVYLMEEL